LRRRICGDDEVAVVVAAVVFEVVLLEQALVMRRDILTRIAMIENNTVFPFL
jgi:hypothetical protein